GIRILTLNAEKVVTEQTLIADGVARPVTEAGCTGSRRAEWSKNGTMLYTHTELKCEGRPDQTATGLHLWTAGPTWLDIQVAQASGRDAVDVRHYGAVSVPESLSNTISDSLVLQATAAASRLATTHLSINDVIDASPKVSSKAIEAALF